MASNAYEKVLSQNALLSAWSYLYSKTKPVSRNTVGVDGLSVNDFHLGHKSHISRLLREIKSNSFQFSELKPYLIPKANGKMRLICVPTVQDRLVQRALVDFLSIKYHEQLANNISFGFVKGRSVAYSGERDRSFWSIVTAAHAMLLRG
jgi:retron-type reverse transcriptase